MKELIDVLVPTCPSIYSVILSRYVVILIKDGCLVTKSKERNHIEYLKGNQNT
jgi:hypothetical protein